MDIFSKGKVENDLIAEAELFYNNILQSPARRRLERMWFEQNAFFEGYQWQEFNRQTNEYLFYQDMNQGRIKTQVNEIEPATLKQVARLVKKKPRIVGRPIAGKEHDDELALVSDGFTGLVRSWEERSMFGRHLIDVMQEAFIQGMAWMNFYYDPDGGKEIVKDYPIFGPDGKTVINIEQRKIKTGLICPEVFNPFDVVVSPTVENYNNIRRIQVKYFQNPDEIFEQYGIKVEPDNEYYDDSIFSRKYRRLINKTSQMQYRLNDVVMKVCDYQLPSKKYPNGRYMVWANGKILDIREELPFGKLMFAPFWCKRRKNKFQGDTFIRQLIPLQKQKNRTVSLLLEILYNHGYPAWVVEKTSGLIKKAIKGESMQILEYNTGSKEPHQIPPGQAPQYAFELLKTIDQGMMDISSQHDVSKGVNPPGLNNAQALNALLDADDITMSLIEQDFYHSIEMCGNLLKHAFSKTITDDEAIEFSSDSGYMMNMGTFKSNWATRLDDIRVVPEAVPDLPYSRPGKIQLVNDMLASKLLDIQNPNDKRLARKIIDFTGITEELSLDEKNAMQENSKAKIGMPIDPPEEWEDHDAHLYVHYKFMKSPEFKILCKQMPGQPAQAPGMPGIPGLKQIMIDHVNQTKKMIPPPPPPDIPKKIGINIKADSSEGNQILEQAGIIQPPPPPPQGMPGPGGPMGGPGGMPPGAGPAGPGGPPQAALPGEAEMMNQGAMGNPMMGGPGMPGAPIGLPPS